MSEASAWALDGYKIPIETKIYQPGERMLGEDEDVKAAFEKTIALLERVESDPPADMPVKRKPVPREYRPDWKQAERFLKFLFPEPETRVTLKVIDNSPAKTGARHAVRSIADAERWLASNAREPWGAYVSPHVMKTAADTKPSTSRRPAASWRTSTGRRFPCLNASRFRRLPSSSRAQAISTWFGCAMTSRSTW
jgi:hypothetical protein